jgi:Ser/Thr protein kinase RdoA (MazF antagonist)
MPNSLSVLAAYSFVGRPKSVQSLGGAGGFSGARFWRVETDRGPLCLRRWPVEYPKVDGLRFIHAVLRHVAENDFAIAPVPLENSAGATHTSYDGHLWELTPWLPGKANTSDPPAETRLVAAMECLAEFHRASAEFCWPKGEPQKAACPTVGPSAGIRKRAKVLREWMAGRGGQLRVAIGRGTASPEMSDRAERLIRLLPQWGPVVAEDLAQFDGCSVPLQPCIRDVWQDHLLFQGGKVSGLIDFGSMGIDNVSCDVARLLGSLAGNSSDLWKAGIAAYTSICRLSEREQGLVQAFDRSGVLLGAFNWASWVLLEGRLFEEPTAVLRRMDALMERLESSPPPPPSGQGLLL